MADLLDMDYINSLPQPFLAQQYGDHGDDWLWPVHDIEVQTGLVRIDVCGKLDTKHIGDFKIFRDANGKNHDADDFYADAEREASGNQAGDGALGGKGVES